MVEAFRTLKTVFSACAEVVPTMVQLTPPMMGILRVRGGSSTVNHLLNIINLYSPRARR